MQTSARKVLWGGRWLLGYSNGSALVQKQSSQQLVCYCIHAILRRGAVLCLALSGTVCAVEAWSCSLPCKQQRLVSSLGVSLCLVCPAARFCVRFWRGVVHSWRSEHFVRMSICREREGSRQDAKSAQHSASWHKVLGLQTREWMLVSFATRVLVLLRL